jgi:nucleoid-associated protein YgaU
MWRQVKMIKTPIFKIAGILVITLGLTVGCASQQKQPESKPEPVAKSSAAADAIAAAKAAIAKAKALGWIWRDTEKFLKKAEAAAKKGDDKKAIKLANKAKFEAETAIKQYYAEKDMDRSLTGIESSSYTVAKGDSLWRISGKSEIYGDPYQWPLIYKANSSKIKDADLIYPGQEFDINTTASQGEIDAAIKHARTRGAWSIGNTEASDTAYLAQ